jgi:hypothetical protein
VYDYRRRMADLIFDQINIVLPDVVAAVKFLRAIGADVPTSEPGWEAWDAHHVAVPGGSEGFTADLDSQPFARHWGGLPADFAGVVVNFRASDRATVDAKYELAVGIGGTGLRTPYDAFWGSRYALVQGPGPIVVGIMSPPEAAARHEPPAISDFV